MILNVLFLIITISVIFLLNLLIRFYNKNYSKIAVVIRAIQPTLNQQKRYYTWINTLDDCYTFWIITNSKTTFNYSFRNVFRINTQSIINKYPYIHDLRTPGHCRHGNIPDEVFYPWISHTESIIEWYNIHNENYKYVWVLEQDIGYSGYLNDFLKVYDKTSFDFITSEITLYNDILWPLLHCCTDNYTSWRMIYSNNSVGYFSKEFIQRWSNRMINKINKLLLKGIHAISETSVPESVIFSNYSYEIIDKKYISNYFSWNTHVSEEMWKKLENETSNKFYHALKF